jgi:hypothetical protein
MPAIRDYHARAAGIPWVREEDYAAFLAICEDADSLPTTWERFVQFSEEAERRFEADGLIVVRAYIDPDRFPDWCRSQGLRVNSQARQQFSAFVAAQQHGRNQS